MKIYPCWNLSFFFSYLNKWWQPIIYMWTFLLPLLLVELKAELETDYFWFHSYCGIIVCNMTQMYKCDILVKGKLLNVWVKDCDELNNEDLSNLILSSSVNMLDHPNLSDRGLFLTPNILLFIKHYKSKCTNHVSLQPQDSIVTCPASLPRIFLSLPMNYISHTS